MSVIPGICLCGAPGIHMTGSDSVLYSLHESGFTDSSVRRAPGQVFQSVTGRGIHQRVTPTGNPSASVRSQYPADVIEFYLNAPMVGEYLASPTNLRQCTGFMASSQAFGGGAGVPHRHGRGQYMLVNKSLAERLLSYTAGGIKLPKTTNEDFMEQWVGYLDEIREGESEVLAHLEQMTAIVRGSMNQVVVAVLHFPR
jgi:hypothetical protein